MIPSMEYYADVEAKKVTLKGVPEEAAFLIYFRPRLPTVDNEG